MFINQAKLAGNTLHLDIPEDSAKTFVLMNKKKQQFTLKSLKSTKFGIDLSLDDVPDYGMYALAYEDENGALEYIYLSEDARVQNDEKEALLWKQSSDNQYFLQSKRPSQSLKSRDIVVLEAQVIEAGILKIQIPKKITLESPRVTVENQANRSESNELPVAVSGPEVTIDLKDFNPEVGTNWFLFLTDLSTKYRLYFPGAIPLKRQLERSIFLKETGGGFLWSYWTQNQRLALTTLSEKSNTELRNSELFDAESNKKGISFKLPSKVTSYSIIFKSDYHTISSKKLTPTNSYGYVDFETIRTSVSNQELNNQNFKLFIKSNAFEYAVPLYATNGVDNFSFEVDEHQQLIYKHVPVISVIIPVFNVAHYLPQAVESVVNQSYGFKNIELIIVNDASTDNTSDILHKLITMYPMIKVIDNAENRGVSAVRNDGLRVATGEYVTFLDGDDYYTVDYLKNLLHALQSQNVNVSRAQQLFFGKRDGEHITNKYFDKKETKVIDLNAFNMENAFINTILFRASFIENIFFDEHLKFSEDVKFLWDALNKNHDYRVALAHNAYIMYRKREEGNSAIDTRDEDVSAFADRFINVYERLFDEAERNNNGIIPAGLQTTALYDIGWTLRVEDFPGTEEELQQFQSAIKRLVNRIDLSTFVTMETFDKWRWDTMLGLKDGIEESYVAFKEQNKFYYELNNTFITGSNKQTFKINQFELQNETIKINAILDGLHSFEYQSLAMKIGKKYFPATVFEDFYQYKQRRYWNKTISINRPLYVEFEIPLRDDLVDTPFQILLNDAPVWINVTGNSKLTRKIKFNFVSLGKYSLVFDNGKYYFTTKSYAELDYLELQTLSDKERIQRQEALALKKFMDRPIWLIADRFDKASDNGEALFRYLVNHGPKDRHYYFVISKQASDYSRLAQEFGEALIVDIYSEQYEIYKAVAEVQLLAYLFNPILRLPAVHLRNITNTKYVFLQHGVSEKINPKFFTHFDYDLDLFVTSLRQEQEMIANPENGYMLPKNAVVNTMFPRFDERYVDDKKSILVFLTWRKFLVPNANQNGTRDYNDAFKESDYYQALASLLDSEALSALLQKYGYKLKLYLHPELQWQMPDFSNRNFATQVEILPTDLNFNQMIAESSMVITDFSSIHFDFAYLKKPVLYYQFDKQDFLTKHTADDIWFDYETMGFGPVVLNQPAVEHALEVYMQNSMKNSQEYIDRIEATFPYFDKNSSQRVYDAVIKMLEAKK